MSGVSHLRTLARVWVDALTYAFFLTTVTVVLALVFGIATGGELLRAKHSLFVVGWGLLAYGTFTMWIQSGKQLRENSTGTQQDSGTSRSEGDRPPDSMATASSVRESLTNHTPNSYGESLRDRPDATLFQAIVQLLPPNRWVKNPRPQHRITVAGKLMLAGVLVLVVSFLMETVFGIR